MDAKQKYDIHVEMFGEPPEEALYGSKDYGLAIFARGSAEWSYLLSDMDVDDLINSDRRKDEWYDFMQGVSSKNITDIPDWAMGRIEKQITKGYKLHKVTLKQVMDNEV